MTIVIQKRVIVLAVGTMLLAGCGESWTKHYRNLAEAKSDGMERRGWLPQNVPADATNITVSGDMDSNMASGSFSSNQPDALKKDCLPAPDSLSVPRKVSKHFKLNTGETARAFRDSGAEVLDCVAQDFRFAYDRQHNFYFWNH